MPSLRTMAVELARAVIGIAILPAIIIKQPSDDYITSLATGAEFVRLNATSKGGSACFGSTPPLDGRCRFLEQRHCETAGCVWADPAAPACTGDEECQRVGASFIQCKAKGCQWERPLDSRVECRMKPESAHAGPRCEAVLAKKAGALDAVRETMYVPLLQIFAFIIGNVWLLQYYGSIDDVMAQGKPFLMGLFVAVAALGSLYRHLFPGAAQ